MMKRVFSGILLLTGCIWVTAEFSYLRLFTPAVAQTQTNKDLFYTFYGKRIPLNLRQDAIAVAFKDVRTRSDKPLYLQLQQDLQSGGDRPRRSIHGSALNVEVIPLGKRYALINLPAATRGDRSALVKQQTQQQPYVESTLPVLSRSDRSEAIVVPNEIVVSFESELSKSQIQALLKRNNLQVIRPLRFSRNRYLVKSSLASGTAVVGVANQLNNVTGVKSATPNFIQSLSNKISKATTNNASFPKIPQLLDRLTKSRDFLSARKTPFQTNLLPLLWHLDSTPMKVCFQEPTPKPESLASCLQNPSKSKEMPLRTDLRAKEAWQQSNGGSGVLVAVIDSLIQWNHPDLVGNVYSIGNVKDKLPGELHGWDFADNDPDTRISQAELARVRPIFQDAFVLSDAQLLEKYIGSAEDVKQAYPDYSTEEIALELRNTIKMYTAGGLFHGTLVSGVIAARPVGEQGLVGVAPNAKILPVTVAKESFDPAAVVEAIGYAAARGADVINMSFGGPVSAPVEDVADMILEVQKDNPNLVFVAAAGNENLTEVSFPATMRGVISVGAINLTGNRASYSNFGTGVDVVAPGGDVWSKELGTIGGILTTGGTWVNAFWQGIPVPNSNWGGALDSKGKYMWVDGTSFASPAVAGVVALMKGEDPKHRLERERLIFILKKTASHDGLAVSEEELKLYSLLLKETRLPDSMTPKQYFFGGGLVNAQAAVRQVKRSR